MNDINKDIDYEILVNKEHLLEKDYVPEGLVDINEPTGTKIDTTYVNRLDYEVYKSFKEMQKDALKEGYEIFVDSSYRSYEYQEKVYNSYVTERGLEYATQYVALPGSSEHQTGLAFDVIYRRNGETIDDQFDTDPEMIWLHENAYKYGFILRYPKGKEDITGFNYEPWHFRYVGKDLAFKMKERDITLEEYHNLKKTK